jgi:hypothetical protein
MTTILDDPDAAQAEEGTTKSMVGIRSSRE